MAGVLGTWRKSKKTSGDVLGKYWPPERQFVEERYRTIVFPFERVVAPEFAMEAQWSLADLLGYLRTWSSAQKYMKRHGDDPVALVTESLAAAWGPAEQTRPVHWPLHVLIGRIHAEPAGA